MLIGLWGHNFTPLKLKRKETSGLDIYTWVLEGTLYHEDTIGGKGTITAGELQRMFSGDWIEHQELNRTSEPARVIQIWYVADYRFRGTVPHYQQVHQDQLPERRIGEATIYTLIGADSPVEQHMSGRLTATRVDPGGVAQVEAPQEGEDLFLYVTDGAGEAALDSQGTQLGQYDVVLASPDAPPISFSAAPEEPLHYLSFYLPGFLPEG